MGYPVSKVEQPQLLTRKPVTREILGDRIWVIEGAGRPRKIRSRLHVYRQRLPGESDPEFANMVTGRSGVFFRPSLPLDELPWFAEFLRYVGNFGLGFQVIAVPEYLHGLEAVVRSAIP